jgi:phosphate transport system substrate-binding protein
LVSFDHDTEVIEGVPKILHIPVFANALTIVYNLPPGLLPLNTRIRLNANIIARMYTKDIEKWNHEDIVALNPFLSEVDIDIEPVGRGDACGASYNFAEFLSRGASDEWLELSDRPNWRSGVKVTAGNQGMADFVTRTPGAIGYVTWGLAQSERLDWVELQNREGNFVAPSYETVTAAVTEYLSESSNPPAGDAKWGQETLVYLEGENSYPISTFLYFITLQSQIQPKFNGAASTSAFQCLLPIELFTQ